MRIGLPLALTGLAILFLFLFTGLASDAFADPKNPCLACHVKFEKPLKYVHPALKMGCGVCHESVEGKQQLCQLP